MSEPSHPPALHFGPVTIARIGDGNIISSGDGSDSEERYCLNMKSSSAIRSGQNSSVVSTESVRNDFICANKHMTQ
jgi:hypothetical protein